MSTKIELKNFKHFPSLSEETYCFTATLVINDIKCGEAKNQGCGGSTDVWHNNTEKGKNLFKQAEDYCLTLPPYFIGKFSTIDMNLENYVDSIVDKLVREKAKALDEKRLHKKMLNAILIGNEKDYTYWSYSMSLADLIQKHPQKFITDLKELYTKYAVDGNKLLNTNIPQQFLNQLN